MKLANLGGRAAVIVGGGAIDVERASGGRFGPDVHPLYDDWDGFRALADGLDPSLAEPFDEASLESPVPSPRQVFAIGLNYRAHAEESGMAVPEVPATFTKFPASLTGPFADVELPCATVDWEVELVAVIGRRADRAAAVDGWSHVAGLAVGQDISERTLQFAAGAQFSLGKSYRGFGPIGPWLVTPDELDDPDDLGLGCSIDGETVQDSRTSDLIFDVPHLVAELSAVLPLLPGDVIFTGTPAGVGAMAKPPRFLQPGQVLETWVEGVGRIRNRLVATP
jgi:2-keto-4-pentenoate hydratase/2-oxohepta-3-ene-1,7-dioic acid hydratase in catechol pathway